MSITRRHLFGRVFGRLLAASLLPCASAEARIDAPTLELPGLWDDALDPAGYLISEKYDGVRGFRDGATLRHRSGRAVSAPSWFTERLPRGQPLDGELWLARGRFDVLSGIVRKVQPVDAEWASVRFMVFDLPGAAAPFGERASRLARIVEYAAWAQLVAAPQSRVADRASLHRRLDETVAAGGEGLVLHRIDAPFAAGRSSALLKLKPTLDAEALVVGHRPGHGKYDGQLGALELQSPDGRRFLLGTGFSDDQRRAPPPLGSLVTYRYRDVTSTGLPRFASFVRVHDPF